MSSYHENIKKEETLRLREIIKLLPDFVFDFFRGIEVTTSTKTRIGYSYDLRIFFEYCVEFIEHIASKGIKEITLQDLEIITPRDFERFLEYLTYYEKPHPTQKGQVVAYQNTAQGKARKLACLRTFFHYFYKREMIETQLITLVELPKITEKNIVRLEVDEVAKMLDLVESGNKLTKKQKQYHEQTKMRDLAIVTLLLGTGIRVSECVGLNLDDVDFEVGGIKITRKGGNETIIYFGDEVETALDQYIEERKNVESIIDEEALFLSMQKKRISVRAIQMMVKKYASLVTSLKDISPHKLRSTYGTNLYRETGDIYLVADVLGHKDVNTTKKHYAQIDDERKRSAANVVKLRE
ncbi:MAG TPA: tyrosine-type recombinase/integrase [Epulopiscium sp.]|nr:tyrosine-type recombinase/integrase [Candidatus Epulonipiscium sp.]